MIGFVYNLKEKTMATNKYYMKVFNTDAIGGYVVNYDGDFTEVRSGADDLASGMGNDIKIKMDEILKKDNEPIYGFRIDYTITPIRTDPFK